MNNIKEYQEMCVITLKNGKEIQTKAELEWLQNFINNWPQMLKFWDELINRYEISNVEKVVMNDLDMYIASITDNEMKSKLKDIVKERKAKWLKVNGTKHLMEIYESRFSNN